VAIIEHLLKEGAAVRAYDPAVTALPGDRCPGLVVMSNAYAPCTGADVLAVLTEWPEFRRADFGRIRFLMCHPAVVDARNVLDPAALNAVAYEGVGRPVRTESSQENSLAVF
jgi:UDPglucose 6-dehydrogenase